MQIYVQLVKTYNVWTKINTPKTYFERVWVDQRLFRIQTNISIHMFNSQAVRHEYL